MKEDILEQIIADWLIGSVGCFTKANVKYKPDSQHEDYITKADSVNSDIDVMGIDVTKKGVKRVAVVTCKSWQGGFNPATWHKNLLENPNKEVNGRAYWNVFRELVSPKWTRAFVDTIRAETNSADFTYYIACTKVIGRKAEAAKQAFENEPQFLNAFKAAGARNVCICIKPFNEILDELLNRPRSTTPAASQLGRLLQVMHAAGMDIVLADK